MKLQHRQFQAAVDKPHLLITGGVHGDEFEPMAALRRLIDLFDRQLQGSNLLSGRVTLVPVVNEAAFRRGDRVAEDELDLARVCPGKPDGSITQQTAHAVSRLIRQADFYIDLHTGGTQFQVLPMAGYTLHADRQILDQQRRMAYAFNLPIVWGTSADLDGRTLSVARDAGTAAIYCEYLGGARCHPSGVDAYVDGCLNVMSELGMLDRSRPASRVEHVVEDPRPSSGHLQVCNPSPAQGYFEPAVGLGDRIRQGQPLGTVVDVTGQQRDAVLAQQTGIVLMLKSFPRVDRGESVGVVLELPGD